VIRLPDGRGLAVRRFGAELGPGVPVVVHNHGGLSCGLDAAPADAAARAAGAHLLAPDRPGVGGSDRAPRRTLLDWPRDVAALLDALGVPRATAVGWSLGGDYALALARAIPDRVGAAAVIAGGLPLDEPGRAAGLSRMDQLLLRLSHRRPAAARAAFRAIAAGSRATAPLAGKGRPWLFRATWGPSDAAVMAGPAGRAYADAVGAAVADPEGMIDEYRVFGAPWGYRLGDIAVPVRIWQGDADTFVPPAWAGDLAAAIPGATLAPCPGEGHLLAAAHWPEILGWLRGAAA
jgi:pimeloyl-ACP methyl ester carboxylesterase